MKINAEGMHFQKLNDMVRESSDKEVCIDACCGQRYIAAGMGGKSITINGVPGNALGAYLNGCGITVNGNAQDAAGDTMNDGEIVVHGSAGDAAGYAMRGGAIYIRDNVGYRAGIHMKAYNDKNPVLVVGGRAGSFLGEYQAGGVIIVLGLHSGGEPPMGYFCGTGMHGGRIYLRCSRMPEGLPAQVSVRKADDGDMEQIRRYIDRYCLLFSADAAGIMARDFYVLSPNTENPYKQLYTLN
ncbi:MAG: glutamate synthase [Firmicutes bacterium]|nr:glutamate synthase [Bacillota bacterium]